jgi:hypothetical protein
MNIATNGGGISGALQRAPRNKKYKNYAVAAATLLSGQIPAQFTQAIRANKNIKTVIMTAGGNDVIMNPGVSCGTWNSGCQNQMKKIREALRTLWNNMAEKGVEHVLYIGYSEHSGITTSVPKASNATKNGVKEVCEEAPLNCAVIDSTPIVGRGDMIDMIHPTMQACNQIAALALKTMEEKKMRR